METASSHKYSTLNSSPPRTFKSKQSQPKGSRLLVLACKKEFKGNWDFGGRLVDREMLVLRKRINDVKLEEMSYEAPADWTGWERRYYTRYGSDVTEVLRVLQTSLLNMRPRLGLAVMAAMALSIPFSVLIIMLHLFEVAKLAL